MLLLIILFINIAFASENFGFCREDEDCPPGEKCHKVWGLCIPGSRGV